MSLCQRSLRETPIINVIFAASITFFPLFLPLASPLLQLPEFAPPQVIYSKDLLPLLFAPWTSPSTTSRVLSRLVQSALLFRFPKGTIFPCYLLWVAIALARTLLGFLLSRSVGWAYPRLFNHWALYESSGGYGPPLLSYLIASGVRPDLTVLLTYLRGHKWEVTESLVFLITCALLSILDHAPWTYGVAVGLALLAIILRAVLMTYHPPEATHIHPSPDSHISFPAKRIRADIRMAFLLLVFILLPNIRHVFPTNPHVHQMPSPSEQGVPFLEVVILSYPRPSEINYTPNKHSILSETISSYLPYVSPSTALSVFTHTTPLAHPSFADARQQFKDNPVTFYADQDTHPDAYQGQYLHLSEAFRWITEKGAQSAEWVMLVEDDFPICGEWGWQGVLQVVEALEWSHNTASPETTRIWGGFVGTGGSGLILHRALLPILTETLHLHALINSPFPAFMARRPPDIIIQDCLLGFDPLCPTAPSTKDTAEGAWFTRKRPTMVITSRLVMDHVGGNASTTRGRAYDSNKWRCGWRHPFHGRAQVIVVPI